MALLSIPAPCCPPSSDGHPMAVPHPAPFPQLLLAGPTCIPWGMFNSEPQRQEGRCHDLHLLRGKLRHKSLSNFSRVLCCRAELGTRQQVPNHQLIFPLDVSTESITSPRRDAHPGVVSNSWKRTSPNSWWGKVPALGCSHLRWSYLPSPSGEGLWSGGAAPSAKAFSCANVQQEGVCRKGLSWSRWGLSISGGFRSRLGVDAFSSLYLSWGRELLVLPFPPAGLFNTSPHSSL